MKIAHLIDSLHWGGAQKLLVTFAETAKSRGLDFMIVSLRPNTKNSPYPAQLEAMGVKVVMLSINRLYDPKAIPALVNLFKRERIDVVQTHLQHANILGVIAGRLAGIPVLSTLHSTNVQVMGFFHAPRQFLDRILLTYGATRVIAVGYSVAKAHSARLFGREIDIIPNAVNPSPVLAEEKRSRVREEVMENPRRFFMLTVGRLIADKGYHDLITAFAEVKEHHPNIFLAIVGGGELWDELDFFIKQSGLENSVRLLGARTDVPDLLSSADIYISSSHREGLSMALMEAMSAGLPILATRVGDTEYLLDNGCGLMVEPHNITALTLGMKELLENPLEMESLGKSAQTFVMTRCAPDPWMDQLLEVYRQAIDGFDKKTGVMQ